VDSLLQGLPKAAEDTNKVKLLNTLSFALSDFDPDAGYKYAAQGLQLTDKLKWKRGIASANHSLATVCYSRSEFDRVIKYATISGQLYDELNDKRGVAINLGTAAAAWYGKSDLTKAIELFLAQQKIVESIGDEALLATCCLNLGNIHYELKNYPKALSFFLKALEKSEKTDDKRNIATCLHNIGGLYSVLGDNKRALEYLEHALRLGEMLGDEYSIRHYRASIGSAYMALGRYAEALESGSKALEISTGIGDKENVANSLLLLGSTYLKIAKDTSGKLPPGILSNRTLNLDKAVGYLEKSAAEAKEADILTMLVEVYEKLSEAYKLSGRTADAYDSYVVYSKLKDSVYSNDNRLKIAGLETRRETELKEKQIEINKTQAKQKQNQQLLFTLGIISLLVTVFMVGRSYRKQKRSNMQLEVANKSLSEEKQKSDKLAAELNESLAQKEGLAKQLELSAAMKSKFFANISHELRTPVTLLTGMLELALDTPETNGHGEKLKVAYSNSRKLQTMVDEILDLSKLESGTSRLNIRPRGNCTVAKKNGICL
jgi:tetratricopeptide (TPR) repeat protein